MGQLKDDRHMAQRTLWLIAAFFLLGNNTTSNAQQTTADKTRLLYAARDVCVGVLAKWANTPDPDGEISYDQGKFKVVRSKSGITVFENNVEIGQLSKFDY